jgi:hypothetical protein
MEANKQNLVAVTVYYASVKFEGKWYTSVPDKDVNVALNFIKRAREKTHCKNVPCNVIEDTRYEAAQ